MNRSKLYDGLSEIERDRISKELTRITTKVSIYSLTGYKAYAIGIESERLRNEALEYKIEWPLYHRINLFLIDWIDNLVRKDLGLN